MLRVGIGKGLMGAGELSFLIVDDDDFIRLVTGRMLRSFGATQILEAENGTKALEILHKQTKKPVDIILCDLNMPEMDGMEFLRHLGKTYPDISVIVISSHDDTLISTVKRMAAAYGVRLLGSVQKPVSRTHLESFIASYKPAQPKKTTHASATLTFTLEDILQGIEEKKFEPFFQPKVAFKTGLICGAEALARWIHPTYGVISPYAFIEPLERSGNISKLTFLILEKTAAACRSLLDKGHAVPISINLPLNSLSDHTLADRVIQVVQNAGVESKYIVLEITESAAMTDVAQSLENLARLRMRGYNLAIDDFGTGFSNIQQITRIAFSELKIDQSFVTGCTDSKELCVVIKSSIEMAHRLKIACTAEGVETRHDWDTLKAMACDAAQGYFIAKPMNLESFLEFCTTYSPETFLRQ